MLEKRTLGLGFLSAESFLLLIVGRGRAVVRVRRCVTQADVRENSLVAYGNYKLVRQRLRGEADVSRCSSGQY